MRRVSVFKRLIIYLFEEYCFDDWCEKCQKEAKQETIKDNNLAEDEYDDFMAEQTMEVSA